MDTTADETRLPASAAMAQLMSAFEHAMEEVRGAAFEGDEVAALALTNEVARRWLEADLRRKAGATEDDLRHYEQELRAAHRIPPARSTTERLGKRLGDQMREAMATVEPIARAAERVPDGAVTMSIGTDRTSTPMHRPDSSGAARRSGERRHAAHRAAPTTLRAARRGLMGQRADARVPHRARALERPIGWIQWYRWSDCPEHAARLDAERSVCAFEKAGFMAERTVQLPGEVAAPSGPPRDRGASASARGRARCAPALASIGSAAPVKTSTTEEHDDDDDEKNGC